MNFHMRVCAAQELLQRVAIRVRERGAVAREIGDAAVTISHVEPDLEDDLNCDDGKKAER